MYVNMVLNVLKLQINRTHVLLFIFISLSANLELTAIIIPVVTCLCSLMQGIQILKYLAIEVYHAKIGIIAISEGRLILSEYLIINSGSYFHPTPNLPPCKIQNLNSNIEFEANQVGLQKAI